MPEMTTEAAIIELNRLKSQERMDIDRERLTAAIDKLTEAGRYQIKRKVQSFKITIMDFETEFCCPSCRATLGLRDSDGTNWGSESKYCGNCGQALDWSD